MSDDGETPTGSVRWRERAAALVEREREPARLPAALLAKLFAHARECYPEECCGLVVGGAELDGWERVRCSNVQDARRARGESDLSARHAFWIDEQELLAALRAAEERDESLQIIYHSHIDTEAYLSHTDLRGAMAPNGTPLYPGVDYLVVSIFADGVRGAGLFEWDAGRERWHGRALRARG